MFFTAYFAALIRRKGIAIGIGIVLMLIANIVGQIYIAGGGPGACCGFIALPSYGALVAWITVRIANKIHRRLQIKKEKQCE